MPPRNHKNWIKQPKIEYISSKLYSDWDLYSQELDNIFSKVWVPVCHESELMGNNWYRTSTIAHTPISVIKIKDTISCLLYTSPSPRDGLLSRMPSSA